VGSRRTSGHAGFRRSSAGSCRAGAGGSRAGAILGTLTGVSTTLPSPRNTPPVITPLRDALLAFTRQQPGPGPYRTAIESLGVLRSDEPKPPSRLLWRPALCIVAQGAKWASFGVERLVYRAGQALLVGIDTPANGQVLEATPGEPCLVLAFELDLAVLREVALMRQPANDATATDAPSATPTTARAHPGAFVIDVTPPLADCALRLVRLLDAPEAIPVVAPLILREVAYWLLSGPQGPEVAQLTLEGTPTRGVVAAMHRLRRDFAHPLRVAELAALAHLSESAFHRRFKALTRMTPVQYQKQLRLLEARRLLLGDGLSVDAVAHAVGYESASQFSREYARLFGLPPRRHAMLGRAGGEAAG